MKSFSLDIIILITSAVMCSSERITGRLDDVKCEAQLKYFTDSLSKHESWAVESEKNDGEKFSLQIIFFRSFFSVFDSWTKFQSGVLVGNRDDFGSFDQCLQFYHVSNDTSIGSIQGQHCLIYYQATPNASTPEVQQSDRIFDWSEM